MQDRERILVAINIHDSFSDQLLQFSQELAFQRDAVLDVVYAVQPLSNTGLRYYLQNARRAFNSLAKRYGLAQARLHLRVGRVKSVILKEAAALKSSVIIIGDHGRTDWYRFMTSIAEQVQQEASCEVLIVKAEQMLTPQLVKRPAFQTATATLEFA